MNFILSTFAFCVLFFTGCHGPTPHAPSKNIGLTGFSTAYTVQGDINPASSVSEVVDAPKGDLDSLTSLHDSKIIEDTQLGNYRIQIPYGGAAILSPRYLLLTDHQILWRYANTSGTVYLHDATPSLHFGEIVANQQTVAGGLTLFELDFPLQSPMPIQIVQNPDRYRGQQCLIPISRFAFLRNNPDTLPSAVVSEAGDMLYVHGKILRRTDRIRNFIDSDYLEGNNFTIRIKADIILDGASGFPVLVYDQTLAKWMMLATSISGRSEIFDHEKKNLVYIHASRMSDELLDKALRAN